MTHFMLERLKYTLYLRRKPIVSVVEPCLWLNLRLFTLHNNSLENAERKKSSRNVDLL